MSVIGEGDWRRDIDPQREIPDKLDKKFCFCLVLLQSESPVWSN